MTASLELLIPTSPGDVARIPYPMTTEDYDLMLATLALWKPKLVKPITPDTGDLDAVKKKLVAEREAHEAERDDNASKIHTLESKVRELTDRLAISTESEASLRRKLAEARLKLHEHNRPYEG